MQIETDPDVKAAAEFLQENFAATKLVPIVEALAALAPLLWGRYDREVVTTLELRAPSFFAARTPTNASQ